MTRMTSGHLASVAPSTAPFPGRLNTCL
jgi:hypothetical protein